MLTNLEQKRELKQPKSGCGWSFLTKDVRGMSHPHMAYSHTSGITVISDAVETQRGWELHMSISKNGKFPSPRVVRIVRKDFDADNFERDDHSKNIASLWLPLNADSRGDCECKK